MPRGAPALPIRLKQPPGTAVKTQDPDAPRGRNPEALILARCGPPCPVEFDTLPRTANSTRLRAQCKPRNLFSREEFGMLGPIIRWPKSRLVDYGETGPRCRNLFKLRAGHEVSAAGTKHFAVARLEVSRADRAELVWKLRQGLGRRNLGCVFTHGNCEVALTFRSAQKPLCRNSSSIQSDISVGPLRCSGSL